MRLLLKYKDKIVSLGLLPTILTLICLHFFPNTPVLGIGTLASLCALAYAVIRLKDLNFFLLQGTVSIGACYFFRLLTDYEFIPKGTITPVLEAILLVVAFVHLTAPEVYKNLLQKLRLRNCFSYVTEAKIIVVLSSVHLAVLAFTNHGKHWISEDTSVFMVYGIPISIYLICLIVNIVGIRLALQDNFRYDFIRVAPICNGRIFLIRREVSVNCGEKTVVKWDVPIEKQYGGPAEKSGKYALKIARKHLSAEGMEPRLILRYQSHAHCSCQQRVSLYIFPLAHEQECRYAEGKFFSFEEIAAQADLFNPALIAELPHLQMAAEMWKEFGNAQG